MVFDGRAEGKSTDSVQRWLVYGLAAVTVLLFCTAQLHWRSFFAQPLHLQGFVQTGVALSLFATIPAALWLVLRSSAPNERWLGAFICGFGAFYAEVLHYWIVDQQSFDPAFRTNADWQWNLHNAVMELSPMGAPHTYRFLPNCIVSFYYWLSSDRELSVHMYRLAANAAFFAVIFRYSRHYLTFFSSLVVVGVVALLYPVSILRYNGQFTDPVSHLSFALCLYLLIKRDEPRFASMYLVGIFAKESIVAMAVARLFYGSRLKAIALGSLYLAAGLVISSALRRAFGGSASSLEFRSISGTNYDQVLGNWGAREIWMPMYLVTICVLLPGAIKGWRYLDTTFRATCLVVVAATVVSNLFISLMWEVRNVVPAFIPLAVLNLVYLERALLPRWRPSVASAPEIPIRPSIVSQPAEAHRASA